MKLTNVYNDDAVICRICGKENFAPGIVISASGAELVISREVVTGDGENAGYTKKVSTKYKAEESNRISFVITPDSDAEGYRNRILSIYVNGEMCGAYAYDHGTNFFNDSILHLEVVKTLLTFLLLRCMNVRYQVTKF